MNPPFQNRNSEIKQLLGEPGERALWYIYGEAGIGKSALLAELSVRIRSGAPPCGTDSLVVLVDMAMLGEVDDAARPALLLESVHKQLEDTDGNSQRNDDRSAAALAAHIIERSYRMPVYLLFDATEAVQQDPAFWAWFEEALVSPLAVEGTLHQIFAGRIPVPWDRYEIRRTAKPLRIEPLKQDSIVRRLIKDTILGRNPGLKESPWLPDVIDVINDLAAGHPQLLIQLSRDVLDQWPGDEHQAQLELRHTLCVATVKPFVKNNLFEGIDDTWQAILWWASVLKWFDLTILPAYLQLVMPALREDDYFFLQGINRLRQQHTVVWREKMGDQLHGVIADIVARCMQTLEPDNFRKANAAAGQMLEVISADLTPGSAEAKQFEAAIIGHRQLAKGGNHYGHQ